MTKEKVIYYPFDNTTNLFHRNMINALETKYRVYDIKTVFNPFRFFRLKKIYLNNVENRNWGLKWKIVFWLIKKSRMEICYFFHNYMKYESNDKNEGYEKVKWLVNWSDKVYVLSTGGKDILVNRYGINDASKIKYIEHINYIDSYPKSSKQYRVDLELPDDALVFCFFGKVRPYKNVELLIDAFKLLKKESNLTNVYLLIAGEPINEEYKRKIVNYALDDHIKLLLKQIPDEDLSSLFEASNIIVLPYNTSENMNSGVAIAAFSYHKTVLISDTEMAKDFDKNGFIFMYEYNGGDVEILASKMKTVIDCGTSEIDRMGQMAYEYVKKYNAPDRVIAHLSED